MSIMAALHLMYFVFAACQHRDQTGPGLSVGEVGSLCTLFMQSHVTASGHTHSRSEHPSFSPNALVSLNHSCVVVGYVFLYLHCNYNTCRIYDIAPHLCNPL